MSLVALEQSKTLAGVEHDRAVSDDRALALRRQHVSYREIARQLGLSSPSRAHAAVRRAIAAEPFDDVEAVRRDIAEQLDEALGLARSIIRRAALVGPASGTRPAVNDDDRAVRALETYVRLLDRKAKLFGADLPVRRFVQVEVITDELLRAEGERLEAELAELSAEDRQLLSMRMAGAGIRQPSATSLWLLRQRHDGAKTLWLVDDRLQRSYVAPSGCAPIPGCSANPRRSSAPQWTRMATS